MPRNCVFSVLRFSRHSLLILVIQLAAFPASAQQNLVDSLNAALTNHEEHDTTRVNMQVQLVEKLYWTGNYDEALRHATEARKLSIALRFLKGQGDAWIASGHTHLRKGMYDSALRHFENARAVISSINEPRRLATTYLFTGQTYDYLAEYGEALNHYKIAMEIIDTNPDDMLLFKILNSMGVTYFNKGSYETALEYYLKAIKVSERFTNKLFYASVLNNMGVVHMSIYQYSDALKYFLLYLATMRELDHKHFIAVAMLNVGEAHMKLADHQQAVQYLDSALTIYTQLSDRRGVSLTHSNLGSSYGSLGNHSLAKQHYRNAILVARGIESDEALLKALIGATELYLKAGDIQKASLHLENAKATALATGAKLWLEKAYLFNSQIDSARGDYKAAYEAFKKYSALNDSLFNERKSQQVVQMRELYESEKKDKEIILLNEARKREELKVAGNEKLLVVSVVFFILIIAGILYWVYVQSRHSAILRNQNDRISEAYGELKVLMDKVEDQNKMLALKNETLEDLHREKDGLIGVVAHDLRSPLNRIAGLTQLLTLSKNLTKEEEEIVAIIQKVCKDGNGLIRDLLDINQYENSEVLTLTDIALTDHISSLISHYSHQLDKKDLRIFFEYDTPGSIRSDANYLSRILDNIITNAIKFSPAGRNIYVKLLKQHTSFRIMIQDEGPGFHSDDLPHLFRKFRKLSARPTAGESSTGLGLSIVKSLTEKIKGTVSVNSTWGNGATFVIDLPFETEAVTADV